MLTDRKVQGGMDMTMTMTMVVVTAAMMSTIGMCREGWRDGGMEGRRDGWMDGGREGSERGSE